MNSDQGHESQELGELGEDCFKNITKGYFGLKNVTISSPNPDNIAIDFVVRMQSLDRGTFLESDWQIKTQGNSKNDRKVTLAIKPKHLSAYYNIYISREKKYGFYIALGKAKFATPELVNQKPLDQFDWFAFDILIYIASNRKKIEQRVKNKKGITISLASEQALNIHTFTLIWAHLWVKSYFYSLNTLFINRSSNFKVLPEQLIPPKVPLDRELQGRVQHTISSIMNNTENLTDHDRGLLNMINSLYDINLRIVSKQEILTIENYCPESLSGSLNLWILSKLYRSYMVTTSQRNKAQKRIKYLPINPLYNFPVYRYALFLVKKIYEGLGVKVIFLDTSNVDEPGKDRGWYSGGIGVFPWITMSEEGEVEIQKIEAGAESETRDFLNFASINAVTGPLTADKNLLKELGVQECYLQHDLKVRTLPNWIIDECLYVCKPFSGILNIN